MPSTVQYMQESNPEANVSLSRPQILNELGKAAKQEWMLIMKYLTCPIRKICSNVSEKLLFLHVQPIIHNPLVDLSASNIKGSFQPYVAKRL